MRGLSYELPGELLSYRPSMYFLPLRCLLFPFLTSWMYPLAVTAAPFFQQLSAAVCCSGCSLTTRDVHHPLILHPDLQLNLHHGSKESTETEKQNVKDRLKERQVLLFSHNVLIVDIGSPCTK